MATETKEAVVSVAVLRKDGTIRIPDNIRRALGLAEGESVTMRLVAKDGAMTLRPDPEIPTEDAWAYTPEHEAAMERARNSPAYEISEEELESLIEADDPQEAVRQLLAGKQPVDDWPPHA